MSKTNFNDTTPAAPAGKQNATLTATDYVYDPTVSTSVRDAAIHIPIQLSIVGCSIDGGASTPPTGSKAFVEVPYSGTIIGWMVIGDASGSAQVTVKKGTPSGDTNMPTCSSIVASDPPKLTTQQRHRSTSLSGWTTSVAAQDVFEFNLDSVTTCKRLIVEIVIQRT